jgi:hypothetical protein
MKTIERILLAILFWVALVVLPKIGQFLEDITLKNLLVFIMRKIDSIKNRYYLEKEVTPVLIYGEVISFSKNADDFEKTLIAKKFTLINRKIIVSKTGFIKVKSHGEIVLVEIPLNLYFVLFEEFLKHQKAYQKAQEPSAHSGHYMNFYNKPLPTEFHRKVYELK